MKILGDTRCPNCTSMGRDSKGNHLILFETDEGKHIAKCPKCGHYEKDASEVQWTPKREWNADELRERLAEIAKYPIRTLEARRIHDWVCDAYGVRVGLSTTNGKDVVEHYYPRRNLQMEICRYNVRVCDPKGFYSIGPSGGVPFGAEILFEKMIRTAKLWIFEDELSAMSGYQVLKQFTPEEDKEKIPACIGLIAGSGTIVQTLQWLIENGMDEKFDEFVYVHDNDKAGLESYSMGRARWPDLRGVCTELKDANDMLMEGRNKELFKTLVRAARVRTPDGAASIMDAMAEAEEVQKEGLSFPWPGLTEMVKIRYGEVSALGGGVGGGKTTLVHAISAHFIRQEIATACFMLEERISKTLHNVTTHLTGVKEVGFDRHRQMQINEQFRLPDLLHLWKNKGANDWDNISLCIRYYATVMGVKMFFVDNITALTNTMSPTEINTEIARIATEASGMADELDIHIMILSHLNPPDSGPSHEEGGEVRPKQFTGGRGLMRWVQLMLGFERNLYAEGDAKHYSKIRVLKDREDGHTGFINTRYNPETGGLEEIEQGFSDDEDNDEPF